MARKTERQKVIDLRKVDRRVPKPTRRSKHVKRNPDRPYCESQTNAGVECPQYAARVTLRGKKYQLKTCAMHASTAIKKELGLVGNKNVGRKKRAPTANDILRERFETEAKRYLQPIEDALAAMRAVVVGNGASAHIQMVDDLGTRLKAAEMMLDRVYGKPKQAVEHSGGDTPVEVVIPQDTQRQRDVAAILAESGALGTVIPANASAVSPTTN